MTVGHAHGDLTIVTMLAITDHFAMIYDTDNAPAVYGMTGLAQTTGGDVQRLFVPRLLAIMTTLTIVTDNRVTPVRRSPGVRIVTRRTRRRRRHMGIRHTRGDASIVTMFAQAADLIVINDGSRPPTTRGMTGQALVTTAQMLWTTTPRDLSIVTGAARPTCLGVIHALYL